jgi:hypothetical protein
MIGRQADIPVVPEIPDATISFRKFPTNGFGRVGGRIVRDDQFEILELLREQTAQRVCKIVLPVIDGHANTHLWRKRLHCVFLNR